MINSVKPNLIVSDSRVAWFRATILFILALIGTVGMWSVVVFIPDIEKEFGLDRGTSSLLYAFTMIGFGFGTVVIGKVYDKFLDINMFIYYDTTYTFIKKCFSR